MPRKRPPRITPPALYEAELDDEFDVRTLDLSPAVDDVANVEAPDELLLYYLALARGQGIVYALDIKWLIDKLYRDHDYLLKYQKQPHQAGYDKILLRDLKALAWLIAAAMRYLPDEVKRQPVPPPPLTPKRSLPHARRAQREEQEGRRDKQGNAVLTKAEQLTKARQLLAALLDQEAANTNGQGPNDHQPGP
jgi:hypothetical protein